MAHPVCPWWLGYMLLNPLRRLFEDPAKLLRPLLREGMVVLEPGCGMGFFTLEAARLAGPSGRVVAVDLQPRMLAGLRRRAARAGLADRIDARLAAADRLGVADLAGTVDVALAIYVVHELPDRRAFLAEVRAALKPDGCLLIIEPKGPVSADAFAATLGDAGEEGFRQVECPVARSGLVALLAPQPWTGMLRQSEPR